MERTYVIPLRKEWLKVPVYKRTKKAVYATREFLQKHMKVEIVKLGRHLNMALWAKGNRNPPGKIEVSVELIKDKEGDYAYAELVGVKKEALKPVIEEKKAGLAGKLEELTKGAPKKEKQPKATKEKAQATETEKKQKEEKDKVLKKTPEVKAPQAEKVKDEKKQDQEKARREQIVKRDMKKETVKKEE